MATYSPPHPVESQTVASGKDFATLSMMVDDLPNSVLVQLFGTQVGKTRVYSLYSVYREGTMTFDAIIRLKVEQASESLENLLRRFVRTASFKRAVLMPLVREVHEHFANYRRANQRRGIPDLPRCAAPRLRRSGGLRPR